jgi:hypothetical protein
VVSAGAQAEGRAHLAYAFVRSEYRDAEGKVVDMSGRNAWRGVQAQATSVRQETVVWLFDLAGGKALWEWADPDAVTVDLNQQGAAGWRRAYGGNEVGAAATRSGLLVTGSDAAVLLATESARKPAE